MTDGFVERFLTKEGESVQEAKARLAAEQAAREAHHSRQVPPASEKEAGRGE